MLYSTDSYVIPELFTLDVHIITLGFASGNNVSVESKEYGFILQIPMLYLGLFTWDVHIITRGEAGGSNVNVEGSNVNVEGKESQG